MITAVSDITQISERQFKARIFRGGHVEIFINPSQSEMRQVASKQTNRVRFTADARSPHKVWVWDASKAIHYEMLPLLGVIDVMYIPTFLEEWLNYKVLML